MHAVTAGNPHLKAAWAGCFSFEVRRLPARRGVRQLGHRAGADRRPGHGQHCPVQDDRPRCCCARPPRSTRARAWLQMWRDMPFRDSWSTATQSRFWYEGSAGSYLTKINRSGTALYVQGGWADDLRGQGLVAFANLTGDPRGDRALGPMRQRRFRPGLRDAPLLRRAAERIDTGLSQDDPIHYHDQRAGRHGWRGSDLAGDRLPAGRPTPQRRRPGARAPGPKRRADVHRPLRRRLPERAGARPDGLLTGARRARWRTPARTSPPRR